MKKIGRKASKSQMRIQMYEYERKGYRESLFSFSLSFSLYVIDCLLAAVFNPEGAGGGSNASHRLPLKKRQHFCWRQCGPSSAIMESCTFQLTALTIIL
jgi:hypothetical protein